MNPDRRIAVRVDAQNPWPGLSPFDESEARFFNGRDIESAELADLVGQAPLTLLFGRSGLGKTSLLQAGLFPRLRKMDYLPIYIRLDVCDRSRPLIDQTVAWLEAEVLEHDVDGWVIEEAATLWDRLHGVEFALWSSNNHLLTPVLVFDAFEETLTLGADNAEAIHRLKVDIADLVENRIPTPLVQQIEAGASAPHLDLRGQRYKVLLSLREDFLPDLEAWKNEVPSLMRNRFRLLPMKADRALVAVRGTTPTGSTHDLVSEESARAIVRYVAGAQQGGDAGLESGVVRKTPFSAWDKLDIEPVLLSLVCTGLNEKRKDRMQESIDATLLMEAGNAIISDFYDGCLADVPDQTRRFIESSLITENGYRNSFPLQDALQQGVLTEPLLRELVKKHLLRIDHQLGMERVELIHDRLTPVVRQHRETRRRRSRRLRGVAAAIACLIVLGVSAAIWTQISENMRSRAKESAVAEHANALKLAVQGKYQDALDMLGKSLSTYKKLGDDRGIATTLIDIGKLHALNSDLADAEASYGMALEVAQKVQLAATEGLVTESLASLRMHQGRSAEVLALYSRARERYASAGDLPASARIREGLAAADEAQGKFDAATEQYRLASNEYEVSGDTLALARVRKAVERTSPWGTLSDLKTGTRFQMRGEKVTVGRNSSDVRNDVSLAGQYVSRNHLVIKHEEFLVNELRSRNGTAVNGKHLPYGTVHKLADGDVLSLANEEVLQFSTTNMPLSPVPPEAWAIFINGDLKSYTYLTSSDYSLVMKGGKVILEDGASHVPLLRLRHSREKREMLDVKDDWSLVVTEKVDDYQYKPGVLLSERWVDLLDQPLTYYRLSADRSLIEEGPSFQLILTGK